MGPSLIADDPRWLEAIRCGLDPHPLGRRDIHQSQSPPKKTKRDNSPCKGKGKGKANRPTWRPGKFNRRYHKQYVLSRRFFEVGFTSKHTTPTTERIVEKSGCLLTEKCQLERCCNLSSFVSDRSGSVL